MFPIQNFPNLKAVLWGKKVLNYNLPEMLCFKNGK